MYIYTTICIKEKQEKTVHMFKNPFFPTVFYIKRKVISCKFRIKFVLFCSKKAQNKSIGICFVLILFQLHMRVFYDLLEICEGFYFFTVMRIIQME